MMQTVVSCFLRAISRMQSAFLISFPSFFLFGFLTGQFYRMKW